MATASATSTAMAATTWSPPAAGSNRRRAPPKTRGSGIRTTSSRHSWRPAKVRPVAAQSGRGAADPDYRRQRRWPERHHYGLGPRLWPGLVRAQNGKRQAQLRAALDRDRLPLIHTMALADLDGDGKPELITGKQIFRTQWRRRRVIRAGVRLLLHFFGRQRSAPRHQLHARRAVFPAVRRPARFPAAAADLRARPGHAGQRGRHGRRRQDRYHRRLQNGPVRFVQQGLGDVPGRAGPISFLPDRETYPGNVMWETGR